MGWGGEDGRGRRKEESVQALNIYTHIHMYTYAECAIYVK